MEGTQNLEQDVEKRMDELANNQTRTEDENKEFAKLRGDKDKSDTKKRIDELTYRSKSAEEKFQQTQTELEKIRKENEELRNKPAAPAVSRETIEAGGNQYFTDKTLRSMIDANQMTETEAYSHQQKRIGEIAADTAYQRIKGEQTKDQKEEKVKKDAQEIIAKYPHFDNRHQNHDPNDPIFKEASSLMNEGVPMKKAVELAEKLHPKSKNVDNTQNLNLYSPSAPAPTNTAQPPPLADDEKDMAERFYRDQTNPATGRMYTRSEAIAKHSKAMADRKTYRETRRV